MHRHPNTLLIQLWLPFLAIILIPMLLLNATILRLLGGIREEEYQRHLAQMEMAGNYLNNILEESIYISRRLSLDTDLCRLAYMPREKTSEDYARLYTTEKAFQKYIIPGNDGYSLHIYYPGNSLLLSTDGSCNDLSYFYDSCYRFGEYSLKDLDAMAEEADYDIRYHAGESFLVNNTTYEGFFYTTLLSRPAGAGQKPILIMAVIRRSLFDETLKILNEDGGFSYITDRTGQILAVSGEPTCPIQNTLPNETRGYLPEEIYGDKYAVSYICLAGGINIWNVKPAGTVIENTRFLTRLALILNTAAFLMCAITILSITGKKRKKLRRTFSLLNFPEEGRWEDYHDHINRGIAVLLDDNRSLSDRLSHNIFLLRDDFWNRLLNNGFSDEQEMREFAAHSDLNLNADAFCLLIFSVREDAPPKTDTDTLREAEAVRVFRDRLSDELEARVVLRGFAHRMPLQQTLLLLRFSDGEKSQYRHIAEQLSENLPSAPSGITVRYVGSRLFTSATDTGNEYAYCCNVLLGYYGTPGDKEAVIWSETEYEQNTDICFPPKLSDRLRASIESGEQEQVTECFREIFSLNFDRESPITPFMSSLLMTRIRMVIIEAYREEMGFNLYGQLSRIDTLPSDALKISHYISLTEKICAYYRENVGQKTEKLRRKIIGYIDENFTSWGFSLTEVAAFCGFSDSYFSTLFRELMQVNFSSYVEKLKMEYADSLLKETDLKIEDIARQTGYSDANTFRRAYKKYYSVSPGQRRTGTRTP